MRRLSWRRETGLRAWRITVNRYRSAEGVPRRGAMILLPPWRRGGRGLLINVFVPTRNRVTPFAIGLGVRARMWP